MKLTVINVILLGSNNTREIKNLPKVEQSEALCEFNCIVNKFIKELLLIPNSSVILVSVIIPVNIGQTVPTNQVLDDIVR